MEALSGEVIMAILGKGDSFGENFAIDPSRPVVNSRASIRALTYCELRMISREDTLHILKQYPLFRENFIKDLEVTYNLRGDDTEKEFLFSKNERHNCFSKVQPDIAEKSSLSSNDSCSSRQEPANLRSSNGPATKGPLRAEAGGGWKNRPTTLNIPNHLGVEKEASKYENPYRERHSKSCITERDKLKHSNRSRDTEESFASKNVANASACSSGANEQEKERYEQSVCKDCCESFSAMEAKLENLSTCLEKLETKLSADIEAMFALLRTRKDQADFQTQV